MRASHEEICREMAEAYTSCATGYSRVTRDYARYPGLDLELKAFFDGLPPGRLLDLGAGSGRDSELAARLGRRVIAADLSLGMALGIRRNAPEAAVVCCDARYLPFAARSFAGVIASGVLLHLPKQSCAAALQELHRVLAQAGRALLSMRSGGEDGWQLGSTFPRRRWFTYYRPEVFAERCAEAGLRVCEVKACGRDDWFSVTVQRPT